LAFALRWNGFAQDWLIFRGVRLWVPQDPEDGITTKYIRDRRAVKFSREQLEHYIEMGDEHEEELRRKPGENRAKVAMSEGHRGTRSVEGKGEGGTRSVEKEESSGTRRVPKGHEKRE
jgi:hypothetical protein